MDAPIVALSLFVGLVVGGLLTVVVERVPHRAPLLVRRRCPGCERNLRPRELAPVVSWTVGRGRCRRCRTPLGVTGPLVEVATAALFGAGAARFGASWELLPFLGLFAALVAVSAIDITHYRIPDRIVFPSLAVSLAAIVAVSAGKGSPGAIGAAIVGAVFFSGVLFIAAVLTRGGIGLGDVKLALLMGLFIGWVGGDVLRTTRLVLVALVIGSLLGAALGLLLGAARRLTGRDVLPDPIAGAGEQVSRHWAKQTFPFGPALAAGTIAVVLAVGSPFGS